MEKDSVVGLDLAKNVFQVHCNDRQGKKVASRKLKRSEVLEYFAQLPPSLVGMEACGGAHEWARRISGLGHEVKMMAPQYVKPYVQREKTDARDARGIAEAVVRPAVPAVRIRTRAEQELQSLHRVRELWQKQRIATTNQLRGLLAEFGEVMSPGAKRLREQVRAWQGRAADGVLRQLVEDLLTHWSALETQLSAVEARIVLVHRANADSQRLDTIPGVGVLTATATVAAFGNASTFATARRFACGLGLTPREHSSGGHQVRLGISKRGNTYVRRLLIHGARSVVKARMGNPRYANDWVVKLAQRRGHNIAVVALAAKNARRMWAVLQSGQPFRADYVKAVAGTAD
jgi:transposase